MLEYRGLVELDTPIINYNVTSTQCSPPTTCPTWNSTGVDYFPNVTLRHLLSQASGYGRVEPGSFFTYDSDAYIQYLSYVIGAVTGECSLSLSLSLSLSRSLVRARARARAL